jgi:hypothetical protein
MAPKRLSKSLALKPLLSRVKQSTLRTAREQKGDEGGIAED